MPSKTRPYLSQFRCSPAELRLLRQAAARERRTVAAYVRNAALSAAENATSKPGARR